MKVQWIVNKAIVREINLYFFYIFNPASLFRLKMFKWFTVILTFVAWLVSVDSTLGNLDWIVPLNAYTVHVVPDRILQSLE